MAVIVVVDVVLVVGKNVSYLFGLAEVRRGAGRLKEALNELTTTVLLLLGPGRIRPTTRSLYRMKPEGRPRPFVLPFSSHPAAIFSLFALFRSFVREEKLYDRGYNEGKAEKERKGQTR